MMSDMIWWEEAHKQTPINMIIILNCDTGSVAFFHGKCHMDGFVFIYFHFSFL